QKQETDQLDSLQTAGDVQPPATVEQLEVEPGNSEQAVPDEVEPSLVLSSLEVDTSDAVEVSANEPHVSKPEILTDETEVQNSTDDIDVPVLEVPAFMASESTHPDTTNIAAVRSQSDVPDVNLGISDDPSVETTVGKTPASVDVVV